MHIRVLRIVLSKYKYSVVFFKYQVFVGVSDDILDQLLVLFFIFLFSSGSLFLLPPLPSRGTLVKASLLITLTRVMRRALTQITSLVEMAATSSVIIAI
jgi:hypothetical protein